MLTNRAVMIYSTEHLNFEPLNAAHADELFPILTTPAVLAFVDPTATPTIEHLRLSYAASALGPVNSPLPIERWFNMAIRLKTAPAPLIGRLEATGYGQWGEVAFLLGEAWWGKGLAFEAMVWWHDYLASVMPETRWWATVHPDNQRSMRLLMRLGYVAVAADTRPELQSYDFGDQCFVQSCSNHFRSSITNCDCRSDLR
jgi:RimJ/RimL family protein N-acetyltransferase